MAVENNTICNKDSASMSSESSKPEWLNQGFVESHLQNYFNSKSLKVICFKIKPATADGENFSSDLYRVQVTFSDNSTESTANFENQSQTTLNIIIKSVASSDVAGKALSSTDLYCKEIEFYECITPKINEMLGRLHETNQLIATAYGVCHTNRAILFEDLSVKNYRVGSIHRGFDFDEAVIMLKKAATFHACNAKIHELSPNIFDNFKHGLMTRNTTVFDIFHNTQFDCLMEVVEKWPNADYYMPKLRRLRSHLMEKGAATFQPDPSHFNTLIQGDLWMNNLMLRNNSDQNDNMSDPSATSIENVVLIDFQFACWTSPAIDLHYFLNTSLQESLRPGRFDELIAIYHAYLVECLKRLEYKNHIPNLDEFKKQYRDKSFFGFVSACLVQPLHINEITEDASIETLLGTMNERALNFRRSLYSSVKVQANLRKLIPMYDEMGIFD